MAPLFPVIKDLVSYETKLSFYLELTGTHYTHGTHCTTYYQRPFIVINFRLLSFTIVGNSSPLSFNHTEGLHLCNFHNFEAPSSQAEAAASTKQDVFWFFARTDYTSLSNSSLPATAGSRVLCGALATCLSFFRTFCWVELYTIFLTQNFYSLSNHNNHNLSLSFPLSKQKSITLQISDVLQCFTFSALLDVVCVCDNPRFSVGMRVYRYGTDLRSVLGSGSNSKKKVVSFFYEKKRDLCSGHSLRNFFHKEMQCWSIIIEISWCCCVWGYIRRDLLVPWGVLISTFCYTERLVLIASIHQPRSCKFSLRNLDAAIEFVKLQFFFTMVLLLKLDDSTDEETGMIRLGFINSSILKIDTLFRLETDELSLADLLTRRFWISGYRSGFCFLVVPDLSGGLQH